MGIIDRQAAGRIGLFFAKPAKDGVLVLRRITTIFLAICIASMPVHGAMAGAKKKPAAATNNPKYASIVIDASTGTVLSERNANKILHPASLTKVMTLVMLFDALEAGTVRLNDRIHISERAAAQQPSKLGLPAGSSIRVEDAILSIVTKSANDISTAIAEHLAGSESRFATRMTRRAHDIGMTRTNFVNAHGLHNPAQVSTARDMATLARYVLNRYPHYYRYFSTKQFTYRGKTMNNHNRLMQSYQGMDGFKTGFINASGFNLIASAKRGDRRVIGVVFGGRSWQSRNDHMAVLLDAGWDTMRKRGTMHAQNDNQPAAVASAAARPPVPDVKPVYREASNQTMPTSLSAMNAEPRKLIVPQAALQPKPEPGVTDRAVANAQRAINSGDFSELTGEGDYDAITARRVETGLIAAAVYKGDHQRIQQLQQASATTAAAPVQQNVLQVPSGTVPTPVALPPAAPAVAPLLHPQESWSVQIGAYTSRVATDDALRFAHTKLPANLAHARPLVVPLDSANGMLFRARFGNLTQTQASDACRYFRDCITISPR